MFLWDLQMKQHVFNLDSNRKEISDLGKMFTCHWMKKATIQLIKSGYRGDPAYVLVIIMHGNRTVNMNEMKIVEELVQVI